MDDEKSELKLVKAMVRSVLMSEKDGVPSSRFLVEYQSITGEQIPFRKLGYKSIEDFIQDIPDVVYVKQAICGECTYFAVADESTAHIQRLVSRQKSKRNKPLKKGPTRFPNKAHHPRYAQKHYFSPAAASISPDYRSLCAPLNRQKANPSSPLLFTVRASHRDRFIQKRISDTGESILSKVATSPLSITVGLTQGERIIQKRVSDAGKCMLSKALNAANFQRQGADKKFDSRYELPPRFRRHQSTSCDSLANSFHDILSDSLPDSTSQPVSKDSGYICTENELPDNIKSWIVQLLKGYPNGLWSSRFNVLYEEEFGEVAPNNLVDLVQQWPDVVFVEMNPVANRPVLFPSVAGSSSMQKTLSSQEKAELVWQDFIVPDAKQFPVDTTAHVYVTYMLNPGHFYVQDEMSCIEDIVAILQDVWKVQPVPEMNDLHPGSFCIALYKNDNQWYRARVLYKLNETEVEVHFIDYGNVDTITISLIRCLTSEAAKIPAQAVHCTLFGLKPLQDLSEWSEEAVKTFKGFVAERKIEMTTYGYRDGQCIVELFSDEAGDNSLNQHLYEMKLADTDLVSDKESFSNNQNSALQELPEAAYIELVIAYVDLNCCFIRLVGEQYSDKLEEFENKLADFYQAVNVSYTFKPGSICIASADLLFHRVAITEIKQNEANCYFLDHGYSEWFPLSQLRTLSTDMNKTLSYQAIPCLLAGLENFMKLPSTVTELVQYSRNKICVAEVVCRIPQLTIMLYDTYGDDDININEQIARKLVSEGAKIDMDIFCQNLGSDLSENAVSCKPLSYNNDNQERTVSEQLQNVGQLCLNTSCDEETLKFQKNNLKIAVQPSLYTWGTQVTPYSNISQPTALTVHPGLVSQPSSLIEQTCITKQMSSDEHSTIMTAEQSAMLMQSNETSSLEPKLMPVAKGILFQRKVVDHHDDIFSWTSYHSWPLPAFVPLSDIGQFYDVYVLWISDPSHFGVLHLSIMSQLEKLMNKMNTHYAEISNGPVVVPTPHLNHLYLARVEGIYYRALFRGSFGGMLHVVLPDFCEHNLITPDQLFFLPKPYWSLPFAAYKARLAGIRSKEKQWTESAKFKFRELVGGRSMVALLKEVASYDVPENILSLNLIDTTSPENDVVVSDVLIQLGYAILS